MSEREYRTVAFDGLSLAGKSTMVAMLENRSVEAEVVRENSHDPFRPTISFLNKTLKAVPLDQAVIDVSEEFPQSRQTLDEALDYAKQFTEGNPRKQALLAFMFTAGRQIVNRYVLDVLESRDVILDRWQLTGWAYQVSPPEYNWQDIRNLNEKFQILVPDVQIILTCPIEDIPTRRMYRDKFGEGTAGQMSSGREAIIYQAFDEIWKEIKDKWNIEWFQNGGIATPKVENQMRHATDTYNGIEPVLVEAGFRIKEKGKTDLSYWLEPVRLQRILELQTARR